MRGLYVSALVGGIQTASECHRRVPERQDERVALSDAHRRQRQFSLLTNGLTARPDERLRNDVSCVQCDVRP